jgi:hypothetical protein
MQKSAVRPYQKWHWAGDEIAFSPVIPAARRVAGSRRRGYDIDIREYLSIEGNAVVRHWLEKEVIGRLPKAERLRFLFRAQGSFDFRADVIRQSMGRLAYRPGKRSFDEWLFPDETLHVGGGDCEDLAFVFAALLAAAGISPDCLRVALGSIVDHSRPGQPKSWDHAWVVYQRECGAWEILEPMAWVRSEADATGHDGAAQAEPCDIEYVPHFVFNSRHLWRIRGTTLRAGAAFSDYLAGRPGNFWQGFNPSFAAKVHDEIFDLALRPKGISPADLHAIKAASLAVDVNVLAYDPRDHFDFAYIDQGWERVRARLASADVGDFALAGHAIADFYAHTLYGYFTAGQAVGDALPVYDPARPLPADTLRYGFLDGAALPHCADAACTVDGKWHGQLVSGQWWRWYTTYPDELKADLADRFCLPDHDAIAVDGPTDTRGHFLFKDAASYRRQYDLRRNTAVAHVALAYDAWRAGR